MSSEPISRPNIVYENKQSFIQEAQAIQQELKEWIEYFEENYNTTPSIQVKRTNQHQTNTETDRSCKTSIRSKGLIDKTNIETPSLIHSLETYITPNIQPQEEAFTLGILTKINTRLSTQSILQFADSLYKTQINDTFIDPIENSPSISLVDTKLITPNIRDKADKRELEEKLNSHEETINKLILPDIYHFMGLYNIPKKDISIDMSKATYKPQY